MTRVIKRYPALEKDIETWYRRLKERLTNHLPLTGTHKKVEELWLSETPLPHGLNMVENQLLSEEYSVSIISIDSVPAHINYRRVRINVSFLSFARGKQEFFVFSSLNKFLETMKDHNVPENGIRYLLSSYLLTQLEQDPNWEIPFGTPQSFLPKGTTVRKRSGKKP